IPEIAEVTFGDKTLDFKKGEYFAPEFYRGEEETEDFTSVGKIRVVVWGTGEADGKYGEAVFEITGNTTPSDELLSLELEKTSVIYNGKEQKPVIKSVKLGEKELDEDEYDVAYGRGASATKNFTDAGIISVTVTGKTQELAGKLCGATYTIKPKEVSTPTIKPERSSYGYTGKAVEPKVSAVYDGSTLIPAKEYTVSYKDNVKLGTGTGKVVVSDKDGGNYTVSGYTTFSIVNNTQYKIILGNGGCWYRGSYYGLGFRCDGPYADFIGITIDGKPVDKAYYVSSEGSTNVGVYPQALNMLGNGTHYITFKYSSGSATGVFYVGSTAINAVMTGDDSNVGLLALVMCLGLLSSVATLGVLRKKKTDA
ncbi:MAG: hypothetical protein IKA58_04040, partial [Clostridia bacterium]|nr:hypothetical protein [Clostridia bacterium]